MLTPAEEQGLSGLSLAGRVRKAFYRIPPAAQIDLLRRIRETSFERHLVYIRDGELDTINVLANPLTVLPDQVAYVHSVSSRSTVLSSVFQSSTCRISACATS